MDGEMPQGRGWWQYTLWEQAPGVRGKPRSYVERLSLFWVQPTQGRVLRRSKDGAVGARERRSPWVVTARSVLSGPPGTLAQHVLLPRPQWARYGHRAWEQARDQEAVPKLPGAEVTPPVWVLAMAGVCYQALQQIRRALRNHFGLPVDKAAFQVPAVVFGQSEILASLRRALAAALGQLVPRQGKALPFEVWLARAGVDEPAQAVRQLAAWFHGDLRPTLHPIRLPNVAHASRDVVRVLEVAEAPLDGLFRLVWLSALHGVETGLLAVCRGCGQVMVRATARQRLCDTCRGHGQGKVVPLVSRELREEYRRAQTWLLTTLKRRGVDEAAAQAEKEKFEHLRRQAIQEQWTAERFRQEFDALFGRRPQAGKA